MQTIKCHIWGTGYATHFFRRFGGPHSELSLSQCNLIGLVANTAIHTQAIPPCTPEIKAVKLEYESNLTL